MTVLKGSCPYYVGVQSIRALTHTCTETENYHKVSEAYDKVNEAKKKRSEFC